MPPEDELPLWPDVPAAVAGIRPYPSPRSGAAAIVVLPGGGYGGHAAHEGEPVALWLNGLGLAAFVLRYRVAPYRHPAPLADAQQALRWVRANAERWGVDAGRVGILGFSAGGHLAASCGILSPVPARDRLDARPHVLVLGYPVVTLLPPHAHEGSVVNLLGQGATTEARRALSLERHVSAETPPTFVWHTADDAAVPVANALSLARALARHRRPFALHVYPHGPHGLGLARGSAAADWTQACAAFLQAQGMLPG